MARKILFYETGPAEILKIVEVPTPEPGAGEIRIRVKAIGLNRAEINFRAATYDTPPAFPAQLGLEASGEIDADPAKLTSKDTVLITAASSSVGLAAIQVTRREGTIPIALTRRSRKADALLQAGAAHVIATEEKEVEEEVKRLTGAKGATVVFGAVGGPSFAKLVSSTSMDGLVLTYGVLSKQMNSFPAVQVFRRRLTIRGFTANTGLDDNARLDALKSCIVPELASGAFKPRIAKTFPFEHIVEAHRYLQSNEQFGKVVVTV